MIENTLPAGLIFPGLDCVVSHEHADVYVVDSVILEHFDGAMWVNIAGHSIVSGVTVDFNRRADDRLQVV